VGVRDEVLCCGGRGRSGGGGGCKKGVAGLLTVWEWVWWCECVEFVYFHKVL